MRKRGLLLVVIMLAAVIVTTACNANIVNGSGDLITETREVSDFDGINLSGSGEVIVTQGDTESLTVETDDNVMEHVKSEVRGATLHLGFEEGFNLIDPTRLIFTVGVDDLSELSISGSGDFESDSVDTDRFKVTVSGSGDVQISDLTANSVETRISGSGDVDLAGEARTQDVTVSGSGKYHAGDLASESVEVRISGSGNATVWATESLDSNISGSGTVNYYGRPSINTSGSGSGQLNNLGEK
ncbi:MAG TPA: head GIN domain-containing protein [Anaerolineae bacterium]|nr:head GIN domain-containing protein [Anaerolineae bacterium]